MGSPERHGDIPAGRRRNGAVSDGGRRDGATAPDDDELLRRARAGDHRAYGELVRRHQTAALRLAAGISGSNEEARDIVQDAFVKGYRMLGSYRGDAPVRAWMLRIVANDAKNARRGHARRDRRETRYELAARPAARPDATAEAVVDLDESSRLLAALAGLADHDREVLVHRYVAGLSEQETADVLGVPVGTVKSRTSRALDRARALVEAEVGRG
jgi:RNA polymerase sigma-70 factor (ECF subfamily)